MLIFSLQHSHFVFHLKKHYIWIPTSIQSIVLWLTAWLLPPPHAWRSVHQFSKHPADRHTDRNKRVWIKWWKINGIRSKGLLMCQIDPDANIRAHSICIRGCSLTKKSHERNEDVQKLMLLSEALRGNETTKQIGLKNKSNCISPRPSCFPRLALECSWAVTSDLPFCLNVAH